MQPYWLQPLRDSTLNWAEWKTLDMLLMRYFPALAQFAQAQLDTDDKAYPREAGTGARPAGLQPVDPAALAGACRELNDTDSAVMQALIEIWTLSKNDSAQGLACLEAVLRRLDPEQVLVVAAVLAQAASPGAD